MRIPGTAHARVLTVVAAALVCAPVTSLHPQSTCAAERARLERAASPRDQVDNYEREAAVTPRAKALRMIPILEGLASQGEGGLAYKAHALCIYRARLAQLGPAPAPVTIVSTQRAGTVTGNMAEALGTEWVGSTIDRPPADGVATPIADAVAALEAGPVDGSRLLLVPIPLASASGARQTLDALAALQKIRMVAGPKAESPTNAGVALFASSKTPAARVRELIAQADEATSGEVFVAFLRSRQLATPLGDVAGTLASVRSQLDPPASAQPARVANAPNTANSIATREVWPLGIAPGNLYVIGAQLVSAKSPAEALDVANGAMKFYYPYAERLPNLSITKECKGPNWGAIVYHAEEMGQGKANFGWACGAATPGDALRLAGDECGKKRGSPCVQNASGGIYLKFMIGHSGEAYSALNNSDPMWITSQLWAMGPPVNNTVMLVQSPEHAIAGLGGMCSRKSGGPVPCFVTFRGYECTQYQGNGSPKCLDAMYTARGVEPLRTPIGRGR